MKRKQRISWLFLLLMLTFLFGNTISVFAEGGSLEKLKKPENAIEEYVLSIDDAKLDGDCSVFGEGDGKFINGLTKDTDSVTFTVDIKDDFYYDLCVSAMGIGQKQTVLVSVDGQNQGGFYALEGDKPTDSAYLYMKLSEGEHEIKLSGSSGEIKLYSAKLIIKDEAYNMNQSVPTLSVTVMGVTIFALIIVIAFYYIWIRHAYPTNFKGVFAGMASYFLICSCLLGMIYRGETAISEQITNVPLQHLMQIIFIMAECAILVVCLYFAYIKVFFRPGESRFGNILAFGLGFTLVDSLSWIISTVLKWIYGTTINSMGLSTFVSALETNENVDNFMESISPLLDNGPLYYVLMFLERLAFMAFIIAMMTLLNMVFTKAKKMNFLAVIWLSYVLYYTPTILKIFGVINSEVIMISIAISYIILYVVFAKVQFSKGMPQEWESYREICGKGVYNIIFNSKSAKKKRETGSILKNAGLNGKEKE